MSKSVLVGAAAFAAGILLLEGTSSLVHALLLQDIPPELAAQGVDVWWMLSRDILLCVIGGVVFALAGLLVSTPQRGQPWRSLAAGVVFALLLEGLNRILPNSLLAPESALHGVLAWGYFIGATALAARASVRPVADGS